MPPGVPFCDKHAPAAAKGGWGSRWLYVLLVVALGLWLYPQVSPLLWGTEETVVAAPPRAAGRKGDGATKPKAAPGATCGNGVIESGEECDGAALGDATCADLGFSGDCGNSEACLRPALACHTNCTFDHIGCTADAGDAAQRFTDNGNGTITDRLTGLVWEDKCAEAGCAALHDVVDKRPWRDATEQWIATLNRERFAGQTDWRLPSREELRTLLAAVPPCPAEPCATAAWDRTRTAPAGYWSSTTFSVDKGRAWVVSFADGLVYSADKSEPQHVRAVRRGS